MLLDGVLCRYQLRPASTGLKRQCERRCRDLAQRSRVGGFCRFDSQFRIHCTSSARVLMQSKAPMSNSRHISGLFSYMVQRKFSRFSADHHPSSSRSMVSPPYASRRMCCSGTPVSVINRTSSLQQLALQFEHVTALSCGFFILMIK